MLAGILGSREAGLVHCVETVFRPVDNLVVTDWFGNWGIIVSLTTRLQAAQQRNHDELPPLATDSSVFQIA